MDKLKQLKDLQYSMMIDVLNSGYGNYGASLDRKASKNWGYAGGGAKEDIDDNIDILRQRSQDAFCGIPLATSAIKTMRTNVVGGGIKPRPSIDGEILGLTAEQATEWERTVLREFSLWADSTDCDLERMNNFYELQQLAFTSWITRGDVFVLLPYTHRISSTYDLRVQLIEADRVCNPRTCDYYYNNHMTVNGIERNERGEVVAYHIANHHPLSNLHPHNRKWDRVLAYGNRTGRKNVLHCVENERIGQSRGVPILAPVLETLKQLGRYVDAELMSALIGSMFTAFIETQTPEVKPFGEESDNNYQVQDDELSMGNGTIVTLAPGESAKFADPSKPPNTFDAFVSSLVRQIGAAIEIPPELLLKQFANNYSASRGALLEAWKMFKMRRTWLINDFCQPIYEEWLAEAVAKGRVSAPNFFTDPLVRKAYSNCSWSGPSAGQLDPVKEANAAKIRVQEGFSTRQQETIELNGGDFYENNRQRVQEETARQDIPNYIKGELATNKADEGGEEESETD